MFLPSGGVGGVGGAVYLVGPYEGLDGQMIFNQLLHVGPGPHHRLAGGALVGRPRGSPGVGVPEEHVPGLQRRRRGGMWKSFFFRINFFPQNKRN